VEIRITATDEAGRVDAGGLVGMMIGGNIRDSSSAGNITVRSTGTRAAIYAGGLIGAADRRANLTQVSSSANVDVQGGSSNCVGGLVGFLADNSILRFSHASGNVSGSYAASQNNVGGIVGQINNNARMERSFSTGNVFARGDPFNFHAVGSLCGSVYRNGRIEDSYATGSVVVVGGLSSAGSLVGRLATGATVRNSYSTARVNLNGTTPIQTFLLLIGSADRQGGNIISSGNFADNGRLYFFDDHTNPIGVMDFVSSEELRELNTFRSRGWGNAWIMPAARDANELPMLSGVQIRLQREFAVPEHLR
jgi:hypothetical protein